MLVVKKQHNGQHDIPQEEENRLPDKRPVSARRAGVRCGGLLWPQNQ